MATTPETGTSTGPNDKEDRNAQALREQHISHYIKALAKKKAADKALRDLAKVVKAEGGEFAWDMIKLQVKIREGGEEAAEAAKAEAMAIAQALRWEGLPVGHQEDMFDEDRRDGHEKAFEAGFKAGALSEAAKVPDEWGGYHDNWMNGWRKGQDSIFEIKKGPAKDPKPTDVEKGKGATVKTPKTVQ